ncbi:MAG: DUF3644 domain-containing protein [Pseudanabaena sp.]|jgi:hypothetical protein
MTYIYENLVENSLQAALSSIEIYNKPDFKYREQVFVILNVNAWELLLKAKILKDSNDDLTSLYIPTPQGGYKTNRTNNPMTIEIIGAIRKLSVDNIVSENITKLIDIRDTAIHFYNNKPLNYLVYTLGVASLKNYQKLMSEWFSRSLLDYNFYVLPLAFAYNFQTLSTIELEKEPETITNIIKAASLFQEEYKHNQESGFYFACEISTEIKSAKKLTTDADYITAIDPNNAKSTIFVDRNLLDKYPLSYQEVIDKIKKEKPNIKQNILTEFISKNVKSDSKYSSYNFRTKAQEAKYKETGKLPTGIACIYNNDAVRFILESIE